MPGVKEIKNRIKSVADTQKITNAMYLVASAKLTSAKADFASFSPYSDEVFRLIHEALTGIDQQDCPYLQNNKQAPDAFLIIGSDKGLAGDYNKQIIRTAINVYNDNPESELFVTGERIKKGLRNAGIVFRTDFEFSLKKPDDESADYLKDYFDRLFTDNKISSLTAIYSDFGGGFTHKVTHKDILPIIPFKGNSEYGAECEFLPDKETIAETLIPIYLKAIFRGIILHAFCSEQNARMLAMKNANDNAKDLLNSLTLEYNHTRQNAITREITEISGERKQS